MTITGFFVNNNKKIYGATDPSYKQHRFIAFCYYSAVSNINYDLVTNL